MFTDSMSSFSTLIPVFGLGMLSGGAPRTAQASPDCMPGTCDPLTPAQSPHRKMGVEITSSQGYHKGP